MRRGGLACLRRGYAATGRGTLAHPLRCAGDGKKPDLELPASIRNRLSKQLTDLFPKKKPRTRGRKNISDSQLDDDYPVKTVDITHAREDDVATSSLEQVAQHRDVLKALAKKKRRAAVEKELERTSRWQPQEERPGKGKEKWQYAQGKEAISVWEAKSLLADGESLLQGKLKREVPLDQLDPEDRVILHGRAPAALEGKDTLDVDSLGFVLSAALDKSKKPWERSGNPYDKERLRGLLESKIKLDKLQGRLGEIEAQDDTKLAPEYNYLKLRGRHLFHKYLDDLAALRKDLMEGLVEESFEEWTMFERHESQRMERIAARNVAIESSSSASTTPLPKTGAAAAIASGDDAADASATPTSTAGDDHKSADGGDGTAGADGNADDALAPASASGKKAKKKKKLTARAREKKFKERMEQKEMAVYLERMRAEALDDDVRQEVARVKEQKEQPRLIWGTLPPGPEHLEYQAHVQGTDAFKGWAWRRPVYYVPRIPWRERAMKQSREGHPYQVDDLELPMDWEENYEHFPYYKRQELWENPKLLSPLPSTEPDWPHRDQDFLDVYLSKTEFVHPGNWDVKLGKTKPSKYKTLQNSMFHEKHTMSPYENAEFDKFMYNPTMVPSHRLGMDLLGF